MDKLKVPRKAGHRSFGYGEKKFPERLVHQGARVEFEHTKNKELAERIAMDHLAESLSYYKELKKMEKKLKDSKKYPDKRGGKKK